MPKPKKSKQQEELKQAITAEMAEDAWVQVNKKITGIIYKAAELMPEQLFQEKHTSGWLWWKKSYHVYYRYFEGSMIPVGRYDAETIKELENL